MCPYLQSSRVWCLGDRYHEWFCILSLGIWETSGITPQFKKWTRRPCRVIVKMRHMPISVQWYDHFILVSSNKAMDEELVICVIGYSEGIAKPRVLFCLVVFRDGDFYLYTWVSWVSINPSEKIILQLFVGWLYTLLYLLSPLHVIDSKYMTFF